jgi:ubiquinone/menaquinone biosynthesis C-methylase UbiE
MREYYTAHPLMISSPFGGVDGVNRELLIDVWRRLGITVAGRKVLDVGCGRGFASEVVEAHGGTYTGVDLVVSTKGIQLAAADAHRLPFPDSAFDAVLCIDAFEHFPDPGTAASEFRRVLRPGGSVFLSVPNYANVAGLVKWYSERFGHYERDTWAPFRNWQAQELEHAITPGKVRQAFRRAGFTRFRYIGHGAEVGLGLFPWLEHPSMPDAIKFRLQRACAKIGGRVVRLWPGASLHTFWNCQ